MKSVPTVLNDIRPESDFSVSKDFITRAAPSTSGRAKNQITFDAEPVSENWSLVLLTMAV
jgi:hypothetical protein